MSRFAITVFAAIILCSCSSPERARSGQLTRLVEIYFDEYLRLFPLLATVIGDHRFDDQLPNDISADHLAAQRSLYTRNLRALESIQRQSLTPAEQLTYDLFKADLSSKLERLNYPEHLIPVKQMYSLPMNLPLYGSGSGPQPFKTAADYENFLKRVSQFPAWIDTALANMREGIDKGIVQPKPLIERTLVSLNALLVTDPEQSIFYGPVKIFPVSINANDHDRLTTAYRDTISETILPAYRKLHDFLRDEYLPKCRDTVALSALSNGKAWYESLVREQTTTPLSPDAIFDIGQKEFERLRNRMEELKSRNNFSGDLAAFMKHLESRPGTGSTNKSDLIASYNALRTKIESQLPKLFATLPKAPYEIRTVEEFRENSAPSQYMAPTPDGSRAGVFYVNAAAIKKGPMHVSESLFLHEAMPGHHFQIALSYEQKDLPRFRRFGRFIAFSEGWGLYSELLGYELGCFTDPLQEMNYLAADMWRAQRLVVDVGLHQKGWSRQQAIDFMSQNPGRVESAEREVDRYIAIPGQALSYKIGQLKISELRRHAENELGPKFNIGRFHDQLLLNGPMPLDLLERGIQSWIATEKN